MCESEDPLRCSGASVQCQGMVSLRRKKNRGSPCDLPLSLSVMFLWGISESCHQEENGASESKQKHCRVAVQGVSSSGFDEAAPSSPPTIASLGRRRIHRKAHWDGLR